MKPFVGVVLLSLVSLGQSYPLTSCDRLVKPIDVNIEDLLGRWNFISGVADIPGTMPVLRTMSGYWLKISTTTQSNVLDVIQAARYGSCFSMIYNMTFENSVLVIDHTFYLKDVFLTSNCTDCVVIYEEISQGTIKFTSLELLSRRSSVSPSAVEMFKKQAECLGMQTPIMMDTSQAMCPDNIPPKDGLTALSSLF